MNKYIIINYYSDKNPERKKELIYCVQQNLNLTFINKVVIFLNNACDQRDLNKLKNYDKILFVKIDKRLDFKTVIDFSHKQLQKSIIIILNLDIFLANNLAWKNIDNFFNIGVKNKAIVCSRTNLFKNRLASHITKQEKISNLKGDFCDAWVIKTPFEKNFLKSNFCFSVGNAPGCDGLMMGILTKFYHVYNYGKKYKIYHYDVCRKIIKNLKLNNFAKNSFIINSSIDLRPLLRINQWVRIPQNQNWKFLLINKKKPIYYFSHIKKNFFYNFKGIYYYFIFFLKKTFNKFYLINIYK